MKTLRSLLLGLFSSVIMAGCATFSRSGGVDVSITNLLPTNASLFETSAALTLRYTNESASPRTLAGSSHKLFLNGTYIGRAVTHERVSIPAFGTTTQTVTVHVENLILLARVAQMSQGTAPPVLAYRLESRLQPENGGGFGTLKTLSTGELDLRPLLNATGRPAGRVP